MSSHVIVHLAAAEIASAEFHCPHHDESASYRLPAEFGSYYITGTPAELRAAANRLHDLAIEAGTP